MVGLWADVHVALFELLLSSSCWTMWFERGLFKTSGRSVWCNLQKSKHDRSKVTLVAEVDHWQCLGRGPYIVVWNNVMIPSGTCISHAVCELLSPCITFSQTTIQSPDSVHCVLVGSCNPGLVTTEVASDDNVSFCPYVAYQIVLDICFPFAHSLDWHMSYVHMCLWDHAIRVLAIVRLLCHRRSLVYHVCGPTLVKAVAFEMQMLQLLRL